MGSRTTVRDLPERAGVSNAIVSNVINDKGKVSESTRKVLWEAIEAVDYPPNASAKEAANENGNSIILSSSDRNRNSEGQIVDVFVEKDVKGIVINPLLAP